MLTTRLHVLIDDSLARILAARARKEKVSMGDLVRRAVRKEYANHTDAQQRANKRTLRAIRVLRKKYLGKFEDLDYRALIEDGRTR